MSKFAIPDPDFERPFKTPSRLQIPAATVSRRVSSAEVTKVPRISTKTSPHILDNDIPDSSSDSNSNFQYDPRFEMKELRSELARCRAEAIELRQERSQLLSRQVEHEIILTTLHGQKLEDHRRIAVLQKFHEDTIGSTLQAAKTTRDMLERHIYKQARSSSLHLVSLSLTILPSRKSVAQITVTRRYIQILERRAANTRNFHGQRSILHAWRRASAAAKRSSRLRAQLPADARRRALRSAFLRLHAARDAAARSRAPPACTTAGPAGIQPIY